MSKTKFPTLGDVGVYFEQVLIDSIDRDIPYLTTHDKINIKEVIRSAMEAAIVVSKKGQEEFLHVRHVEKAQRTTAKIINKLMRDASTPQNNDK